MRKTKDKIAKIHIRKNDNVRILSGRDRGKEGRVQMIISMKDPKSGIVQKKAIVEGLNMVTKHQKPNQKNQHGGIVQTESAIHISKLMLIDPNSGKATRVGRKKTENGWVRVAKKTGEIIK